MAGEKPVMLLGRGYNEQIWIKGVLQIASDAKLQIVEGPFWDASADAGAGADLPDWYSICPRAFAEHRAWYICRARAVADEVAVICETAAITVAQEARLLNYPNAASVPTTDAPRNTKASGWICCAARRVVTMPAPWYCCPGTSHWNRKLTKI